MTRFYRLFGQKKTRPLTRTGILIIELSRKSLFHHLAGFKAACAYPNPLGFAIDSGVNRLQIYIEASFGDVMSVADIITEAGLFSANFANLCHYYLQISVPIYTFSEIWQEFSLIFFNSSIFLRD